MATVIAFEDVVRARRRRTERAELEACVEILSANLRLALDAFEAAPAAERPVYARRLRHLGALLDYAVHVL